MKIVDDIAYGNRNHHIAFKGSICHTFRTSTVGNLPVYMFKDFFSSEYGRKAKYLQAIRDITDEEAIEAYCFNYAFVYALDLGEPDYLGARTYYYYREKLLAEGRAVFETNLKSVAEKNNLDAAFQRIDSTMVQTNLARMSRLELLIPASKNSLLN